MTRIQGKDIKMPTPCVLTIGKFESIHAGHRKLIAEVLSRSRKMNLPSAAVTFDPHPRVLFGNNGYRLIFTTNEREVMLDELGIDYLLVYPFDEEFASQSPSDFCRLMFDDLQAKLLVVGEGFRFGKNGAGTAEDLIREAARRGAEVAAIPHRDAGMGIKISTTDIRKLVADRALEDAALVMGFPFFILGTVTNGHQIGRRMGYPTVNILPAEDKLLPADGVYATRTFFGGKSYMSVTNVGVRPTVHENQPERTVESFLIGFDGDLYNTTLRTDFLGFIRYENKFNDINELRNQIAKDIEAAAGKFDGNK